MIIGTKLTKIHTGSKALCATLLLLMSHVSLAQSDLRHAALNRLANADSNENYDFEAGQKDKDWLSAVLDKDVVLSKDEPKALVPGANNYAFEWQRQDLGSKVKRDYEQREKNVIRKLVGNRWSNYVEVDIRKRPKIALEFGFD